MSYIGFLNRQQRMIERGVLVDDFEDDEEGQSEDESEGADENDKTKTKTPAGKNEVTPITGGKAAGINGQGIGGISLGNGTLGQNLAGTTGGMPNQINDFSKILVAGEGFGKEYLKNEIDRLIKILQDKQSVGQGVHTFIRVDGPRKGWEEDNNQKAGLFSDRGGEIEKIDEGEEDDGSGEKSEKGGDGDALKASIKSKKAFSMAINDKTMPPAIKRLSTTA